MRLVDRLSLFFLERARPEVSKMDDLLANSNPLKFTGQIVTELQEATINRWLEDKSRNGLESIIMQ